MTRGDVKRCTSVCSTVRGMPRCKFVDGHRCHHWSPMHHGTAWDEEHSHFGASRNNAEGLPMARTQPVVRGPQQPMPGVVAGVGAKGGKTDAERAKEYRKNKKLKNDALATRAAFANLQQQPGSLPVQQTIPDEKVNPAQWSTVPTIAPKPADPEALPATNPDGTPAPASSPADGPQPIVTAAGTRRPPTEAEEASAEKLGERLAKFWDAGALCAEAIYELRVKNDPEAPVVLKTWMGVLVKEWKDKDTRKIIKAAGAELAIKWGVATVASPPPEVIVLGAVALSGLAHLGALQMDQERAANGNSGGGGAPPIEAHAVERHEGRRDADADPDDTPSDTPPAQSWSQFGKMPKGASS